MISINLPKNLTFGMKLLYALLGVSIIVVIVAVIVFNRNTYLAKTMKLVRAEGTVKIEKEGGKLKPISKNSRFESGEALFTGLDGLATVSLDDTKFVTLKPDSRVEFSKINKQLGIKLTKGGMFFEVTEKLTEGEVFEIKTSTMTAGIKGTSGYFCLDSDGNETLTVTDGKVIISAVNPETGERKYAEVSGGQRITVYLYSESNKDHDTIELDVKDVSEEDLEDFTIKMLCNDEKLLTRVCEYTGWDRQKLKELLNEILAVQVTPIPTESETSESESSSEESETETQTEGSKDNTPTPTPEETKKPEATNTPKPKATATPKPKAKATATPKPQKPTQQTEPSTSGSSSESSGGGSSEPTSGGGGSDPTSGGGGSDPTSGGGGSDPTSGGGGGSDPTSGGGGSSSGGGGSSGGESGGGNSGGETKPEPNNDGTAG